ncbi:hypothetical protein [Sinomonas humi]|uniref:Uncharacterized protein n=1 Tax=Sinomonas humi TaxID=1338436 RepID=A0A0B2AK96_9MICC|nr:hypothetical protein [Sinomonas humi]KHL03796.1 hypothetical protein LK10_08380 [Sinomonas humi]
MADYTYRNLTSAIADKASPLRLYLDQRFPNARALQKDYRSRAGELRVPGGTANGGTLGAAFDFRMRFLIDASYVPEVAVHAFTARPDYERAVRGVIKHAQKAAKGSNATELDRACWALALCTEAYRAGVGVVWSLVQLIEAGDFTVKRLLLLAPDDALRQLVDLDALAREHLIPQLEAPFYLGPTFDGSMLCPADADVISGGLLLDFKAGLKGGALTKEELYQLLGYTFFDRSDRYGINRIGIYAARFGALITWDLASTLELLAGEPVDVAEERETVWGLLGGTGALKARFVQVFGVDDGRFDDHSARGEDDDSGYGPDSYFARAMDKDD